MPRPLKGERPWPTTEVAADVPDITVTHTLNSNYLRIKPNNHCAAVCTYAAGGVIIAFYTGREGTKEQRVVLVRWHPMKGYSLLRVLPVDTGNPVLWSEPDGGFSLLFSRFERTGGWVWADCSLWLVKFDDKARPTGVDQFPAKKGLLGRCPPILALRREKGSLLLPLYSETPAYGAIYLRRGPQGSWKRLGTIGRERGIVMQSSLWTMDGQYFSFSRNHKRPEYMGEKRKAWYSRSEDGRRWDPVKPSVVYDNTDNSILVVNNGPDSWVVWNQGEGRGALMLAPLQKPHAGIQLNTGPMGSYPNYCWEGRDLHLVWTETVGSYRDIAHRVIRGFRQRVENT